MITEGGKIGSSSARLTSPAQTHTTIDCDAMMRELCGEPVSKMSSSSSKAMIALSCFHYCVCIWASLLGEL